MITNTTRTQFMHFNNGYPTIMDGNSTSTIFEKKFSNITYLEAYEGSNSYFFVDYSPNTTIKYSEVTQMNKQGQLVRAIKFPNTRAFKLNNTFSLLMVDEII